MRIVVQAGATGTFCEELFTEPIALFSAPLLERARPGIIAVVLRVILVTWRGQDGLSRGRATGNARIRTCRTT